MDDAQLLKITADHTDEEIRDSYAHLRASHARLCELVEEQQKLLDKVRRERDEARKAAKYFWRAGDPWCEHIHHEPSEYHKGIVCPVVSKLKKQWPWLEARDE